MDGDKIAGLNRSTGENLFHLIMTPLVRSWCRLSGRRLRVLGTLAELWRLVWSMIYALYAPSPRSLPTFTSPTSSTPSLPRSPSPPRLSLRKFLVVILSFQNSLGKGAGWQKPTESGKVFLLLPLLFHLLHLLLEQPASSKVLLIRKAIKKNQRWDGEWVGND